MVLMPILCGGMTAAVVFGAEPQAGFTQLTGAAVGITFSGSEARTEFNTTQYIENAGVAAGDVNGDGWVDLFFCGLLGSSQLFLNQGDWSFVDASAQLQGALEGRYLNASTFADTDGDGDLDLLVGSLKGDDALLTNDGTGQFTLSTAITWATSPIGGITSFALADIEGDGDLDLYTTRYLNTIARDSQTLDEVRAFTHGEIDKIRRRETANPEFLARYSVVLNKGSGGPTHAIFENGLHDVIYLNDGQGNYTPSSNRFFNDANIPLLNLPEDWGLTATFRDADGDGDPDLYVCNDFNSPDRFWINDGTGSFHPSVPTALRRTSNSSMGVDFADINNDGHQDLFVVDMLSRSHSLRKRQMGEMAATLTAIGEIENRPQIMQNTLFLNRGDNTWTEIAQYAGLKASEWSWAPVFVDIDLDGFDDLIITTGSIRDFTDADVIAAINERGVLTPAEWIDRQSLLPPLPMRNFLFRNRGDLTFSEESEAWGFTEENVSGGIALADLDNDGDLDLAINNTEALPEIYRNDATAPRLAIRLRGPMGNTQAIGAKIVLEQDGRTIASREIFAGGIYASGFDTLRVFARPTPSSPTLTLKVSWPDGRESRVAAPPASSETFVIDHTDSVTPIPTSTADQPLPYFVDRSSWINHTHHEETFNDFARQPLLPNRLSQLGPGISWLDLDADGDDDLLIPSGTGAELTIFANLGGDKFAPFKSITAIADQTTVLGQRDTNGTNFLIGMSNYENQRTPPALPFSLHPSASWSVGEALPPQVDATGPLAQADIDQDGDLDLFVGGRLIPGQYPKPATSRIYRNDGGILVFDPVLSAPFQDLGLVSGATFGDLDRDGDVDLVLALEWGPITVFDNDRGEFVNNTAELGLAAHTGWWNGVALGDFDHDGVLEIVATNWGRNSKYEGSYGSKKGPLQIYYGDVDGNGVKDIIEAHFDLELDSTVPERGFSCSARAMPFVGDKMETFRNFGMASLDDIFGEKLDATELLEANTLEHTIFFRTDSAYRAQPLPILAQLAPALGVCIGDMDGDGHDDIFLSQNFFATQIETPRNDGGRGLWLRGDGTGQLEPMLGHHSGVIIYGEQRGAALSDFDRDGRVDLAVAQNGAATKLFHNVRARPGLRVSLIGPANNPSAVGAIVQLHHGPSRSPARSISSGSGYWSQESAIQVFGLSAPPTSVAVQWPDGSKVVYPIPTTWRSASELVVDQQRGILPPS